MPARAPRLGIILFAAGVASTGACAPDAGLSPVGGPPLEFPAALFDASACEPMSAVFVMAMDGRRLPLSVYTEAITVELVPGTGASGAILSGTRTIQAAHGVTAFEDLSINLPGDGFSLRARAGGVVSPASPPFSVRSGVARKLVFTASPATALVNNTLSTVRVTEVDACGSTILSPAHAVSVSFGHNPGGGSLGGTTTMPTVQGVATFADLVVTRAGAAYTLIASTTGLVSATSLSFTVAGTPLAVR